MGSSRSAYRGGHRRRSRLCLGILDISYRNKNLPSNVRLLVSGTPNVLCKFSRTGLSSHVSPGIVCCRHCSCSRRGLDSNLDSNCSQNGSMRRQPAQHSDLHPSHLHRSHWLRIVIIAVELSPSEPVSGRKRCLSFRGRGLGSSVLVFVENVHCRVFLHVVIPVQMLL